MSALPRPDSRADAASLYTVVDPALPARAGAATLAIKLEDVGVDAAPRPPRLRDVSLAVAQGEHWGVLGANGSGKSTLLEVISGRLAPSAGTVVILGEQHGAIGFRDPGLRIGVVDGALPRLSPGLTGLDVVLLRRSGPAALMGTSIKDDEVSHARGLLQALGCGEIMERPYNECSQGQRQRINLARALLREPAILLLDEPSTALDLPGRAAFLVAMFAVARDRPRLTTVTVTHHVEELPPSTTHLALLRDGRLVAAGRADDVLSNESLSACFGIDIAVEQHDGGWSARVLGASW